VKTLRDMARGATALVRRSTARGRSSHQGTAPEGLGIPPPIGDLAEWASSVVSSVRTAPPAPAPSDVDFRRLRRAANEAFAAGNLRDADFAYAFVAEHGAHDYFLRLRRADLAAQFGDLPAALRQLDELIGDPAYDYRGDVVRATTLLAAGRPGEAAECLRRVLDAVPERLDYARMLFYALERAEDTAALAHPEGIVEALPPPAQFEFVLSARCFCDQLDEVREIIGNEPEQVSQLPPVATAWLITALADKAAFGSATRIAELTGALQSESPDVAAAVLILWCAEGRWQEAGQLVERCQEVLWRTRDLALWRSIVRFFCLTSRLDEARDLIARWSLPHDAPTPAAIALAVLLSTVEEWNRLISYVAERVDAGMPIWDRQILDALQRATRETRRYGEVAAVLTLSLSAVPHPAVEECRDGLLVEEGLFGEIGLIPDTATPPSVPEVMRRMAWWRTLLGPAASLDPIPAWNLTTPRADPVAEGTLVVDGGFYLCTDANYLVGTCVALWSLLRHTQGIRTKWPITVVCHPAASALASTLCGQMERAAGVPIRVVPADTMMTGTALRTRWGVFTSHPGLTEATYYRVFGAQWLAERKESGRAIYLDADTVPGAGIEQLFSVELDGMALAARSDAPLTGVRQAAARLGKDLDSYFNAGVMIIDLGHVGTRPALERSIEFAEHHQDTITFFDQCALNVGFADLRASIPDRFNHLISSGAPLAADAIGEHDAQPVVRHFIGPPKPWDPSYAGGGNRPWLVAFTALRQVLTSEQLRTLLALAFTPGSRTAP
jgi:lipopolysaccharide biosynthesis glycosyltransferase